MSSTPERRRPHQAVRRTKAGSSQNGNSNIADPELAFIAALVNSCDDAIVGTDLDGVIRTWNPAAERLYGYRAEEIIGAPLSTLSPEAQNETAALLNRIRSGERINRQPAVRRKQDGQLIAVDIAASPVRDPQSGEILGVSEIARDTSGARHAEDERDRELEAIRKSEDHYRCTVELSPQVTWTAGPDGQLLDFSPQWLALVGLTREQAMTTGWTDVPHPDDLPRMLERWSQCMVSGEAFDLEHRIRVADGSYRWMRTRAQARRGASGGIVRWYGTTEDIDQRRRAEEQLRHTAQRFSVALKNSEIGVFEQNSDLRYTWAHNENPVFPPEAILGKTDLELNPGPWCERLTEVKRRILSTGAGERHTFGIPVTGEEKIYDMTLEPLRDAAGAVVGITGSAVDITRHKRIERDLRVREQQHRFLANALPQFVWVAAANGETEFLNDHWFAYTGMDRGRPVPETWPEVIHPEDLALTIEGWFAAVAKRQPYELEYRVKRASDGAYRWHLARHTPILDEQGEILKWIGVAFDIDDRRRAAEAVQESEARFRTIVDTAAEGIWIIDVDSKTTFINGRMAELLGYPADEILGRSCFDFIHPDDRPQGREGFEKRKKGDLAAREYRAVRADGSIIWLNFTASPMRDAAGTVTGVLGMCTDITERKNAEQALRDAHQQINAVITSSPLPIVALTSDGDITMWNPAAERVFGWTADEVMGYPLPFIPEEKRDEHRKMRQRDLTGQGFTNLEITRRRRDGTAIDLSVSTAPLQDPAGRVVGIMSVYIDITERRRMEHELRESEAKFRALIQQSPLSTQVLAVNGHTLMANPAWERLWGVKPEEIADFDAFGDPQLEKQGILPYLLRARAGEIVRIPEISFVPDRGERKDETVWVRAYAYPVRDEHGAVRQIVLVHEDVTERRRIQEALRAREEWFRRIFAAAPTGMGLAHIDGRIGQVNAAYEALTGYTAAELGGRSLYELIHPADRPGTEQLYRQLLTGDIDRVVVDKRYVRKDGEIIWVRTASSLLRDPQGRAEWILGIAENVTDRKQFEEELRASEARLRVALQAGSFGVWEWNPQTGAVTSDETLKGLFGLDSSRAHVDVDEIFAIIHPEDRERVNIALQRALRAEAAYDTEFRVVLPDGTIRWLSGYGDVMRNESGEVARVSGLNRDITARKHVEEQLTISNEDLRRANRELEEFAYVASHDLQEPLRTISIYTQLLLRRFPTNDGDAPQYASFIRHGVGRMQELINDVLSYSRTVYEDRRPASSADLGESLSRALETLSSRITDAGATVSSGDLPTVAGDTVQLALVFQNLLSNSLKYHRASVAPEIHVSAEAKKDEWIICVRDNGIGFKQEYAQRIFGLFKRLHKDEYPGTGLGLAICQRIVERYGGRMWAEGRPDEGAMFYFALPKKPLDQSRS